MSDRRYLCSSCEGVVRARWTEPGGFHVGCDCTTVPVVPQMGQGETPDCWHVEREECCRGAEVSELETCYAGPGQDYRCPECGATFSWDGQMATAPDTDDNETVDEGQGRLLGSSGGGDDASP